MRARSSRRRGVALIYAALLSFVLCGFMGLAIDGVTTYLVRQKLSQAVDAGVLSGARSLSRDSDVNSQRATAAAVAEKFFDANFFPGLWGVLSVNRRATITEDNATHIRSVQMTASATAPLYFLRVLNRNTVNLSVVGEARRRDVNVMLVLDRSSSMVSGNAIEPMKTAARSFVDKFASGRDKLGLVVFGGSYITAFRPSSTFKTASTNVSTLISRIATGGNTGTAQALWAAYTELASLSEPGALNVIVLFTDGNPNGITADYNPVLRSTSSCTQRTAAKVGFIAQWAGAIDPGPTAGVIQYQAPSVTDTGEGNVAPGSNGCAYNANRTSVRLDIQRIPNSDLYGNSTTGYRTVDLTRVDLPTQIVAASTNAGDHAARRIRQDTRITPVIYVVGLGGTSSEPFDDVFMKRVANDISSANHTDAEPTGLYVFAPSPSQLQGAFERIASEILRLTQ